MPVTQEIQHAVSRLLEQAREVEAGRLAGRVRVVSQAAVEELIRRMGDAETIARLQAQINELETRCELSEAEARRRAEQVGHLESELDGAKSGGGIPTRMEPAPATAAPVGDLGAAVAYLDLVEQPDYAGLTAEIEEAREDLRRIEGRLGGGPGAHELATAIMKALGDDEEGPKAGGNASPNLAALRRRLDEIADEVQRDGAALSILFEAMLDGNGTVSLLAELLTLLARDHGYIHELRAIRRAAALVSEIPIPEA